MTSSFCPFLPPIDCPLPDLVNIFKMFIPQLLRYPNPTDPLNGEAAALLMRDPDAYANRIKDCVRLHASSPVRLDGSPAPSSTPNGDGGGGGGSSGSDPGDPDDIVIDANDEDGSNTSASDDLHDIKAGLDKVVRRDSCADTALNSSLSNDSDIMMEVRRTTEILCGCGMVASACPGAVNVAERL